MATNEVTVRAAPPSAMASMKVHTLNDVNIYNLTSGKTLPQWAAEKNRRALAKDEGFRRRIELLQDLDFPTASKTIKCSADGNYVGRTAATSPPSRSSTSTSCR